MNYPEHEKLKEVQDQSQIIGEFLEWLRGKYELCEFKDECSECFECGEVVEGYYPIAFNIEKILADYYDVDLNKLEQEKREMIKSLQKG